MKNTVPVLAEAMEKLRANMIIFRYQLNHIAAGKLHMGKRITAVKPELERYTGLVQQIKKKNREKFAVDRVKAAYGKKYDPQMMVDSKRKIANLIGEQSQPPSVREHLRQKQHMRTQRKVLNKKDDR